MIVLNTETQKEELTVHNHNGTFRKVRILPEQGTEPSRIVVKFWLGECKKTRSI